VVVVTRYFGGKKLGTSGLIRAYGKGVSDAISVSDIVWLRNFYEVKVEFDYTFLGKIDNFISKEMYHLKEREYLEKIHNVFYIKIDDYSKFKDALLEITSDNIDIEIIRELQIQVKDNELIY
ncbi:MAG: YigZ family protein, partial [Helcococcus sp.]|nr:YigZ family protein [Helcococcus sp.]